MSDKKADDLITVTISVDFRGLRKEADGHEEPVHESYGEAFSLSGSDRDFASHVLDSLSKAIQEERVYGWLQQEIMDVTVGAGDIRPETMEEELERCRAEWATRPDQEVG